MTARLKTGEKLKVSSSPSDWSFRTILLIAVMSMHPVGQNVLRTWGFPIPESGDGSGKSLVASVDEIKKDISIIKTDVLDLRTKVAKMELTVTGFQVDFEKYKDKSATR